MNIKTADLNVVWDSNFFDGPGGDERLRMHEELHLEMQKVTSTKQRSEHERKLWNIAVDFVIQQEITAMNEVIEFVKLLQQECTRTLGNANETGVPGGFKNFAEYDSFIAKNAEELRKHKRYLKRSYTNECNRELTDAEKICQCQAEEAVRQVCSKLHLGYEIDSDPRGAVLTLHLPSGKTNGWGGTGWVVP